MLAEHVLTDYVLIGLIGFAAQLVDGALGMAFGVISTTAMLSIGMAPAQASAIVHTAEIFTTGASAGSHIYHRNVDWRLVSAPRRRGRARRGGRRMDPVEHRREHHAAVRGGLSRAARHLHPAQGVAARAGARRARAVGRADWICRRLSRCERRRRLGSARDLQPGRLGSCAAHGGRLGQHHRVLRYRRGRHHLLRRTRRLALAGAARADHRRHAGRAARRLGGQAHSGARPDDRGRLPGDRAVVVADRAGAQTRG